MNEDRSRQRLGRGLASLIGSGAPAAPLRTGTSAEALAPAVPAGERKVLVERLSPNPRNPRRSFDDGDLADLAASIRTHGVVQPILVRSSLEGSGDFEIVAGERRWRAAKAAGLLEVPVIVREISDRESLEIAIIENVQRADLNAIEEAQAYEMLIEQHGYTQADLADALGKSRSHVANTLRLLKLPDPVRLMLVRGELSPGHARTAVSAEDPEAFARTIVERGLTVREAEDLARRPTAAKEEAPREPRRETPSLPLPRRGRDRTPSPKDEDTAALERLLSETLGMRVQIRLPDAGGDIRIDYGTLEQLDEICRLLQARQTAARLAEPRIRDL